MELKYFIRKPKLVLWGCGAIINKVLRYASEVDAQIEECVDSAVEKQGKMLSDVCGGG